MKATWVLDSSVALTWCFTDEATPATSALLDRIKIDAAVVPSLWYLEITNVLALAERKGRLLPDKLVEFSELVSRLNLDIDLQSPLQALDRLLPLCRLHKITSYDALYLDLAVREQLPLASLDRSLRSAASAVGIRLLELQSDVTNPPSPPQEP